jgi:hypothetical protein
MLDRSQEAAQLVQSLAGRDAHFLAIVVEQHRSHVLRELKAVLDPADGSLFSTPFNLADDLKRRSIRRPVGLGDDADGNRLLRREAVDQRGEVSRFSNLDDPRLAPPHPARPAVGVDFPLDQRDVLRQRPIRGGLLKNDDFHCSAPGLGAADGENLRRPRA